MLALILILVLWIPLFSLILHDATSDDQDGSAVFVAAKIFAAFLSWTAQKLRAALKKSNSALPVPQDTRVSITETELELAIAETVKSAPGCEDFVGVIIRPKTPKSRLDADWELRGVRFGKTDRKIAYEHLEKVVAHLQQEFRLTGHHQGTGRDRA